MGDVLSATRHLLSADSLVSVASQRPAQISVRKVASIRSGVRARWPVSVAFASRVNPDSSRNPANGG